MSPSWKVDLRVDILPFIFCAFLLDSCVYGHTPLNNGAYAKNENFNSLVSKTSEEAKGESGLCGASMRKAL